MDDLQPVSYGTDSSPSHQDVIVSRFDFEETLVHLRQAIANADLWLIHEINPQMFLARGGYAIQPVRQLFYFHPRYVAKMLPIDIASFPEIPLKLVILQTPDDRVTVRHNSVESLLGRYPGLSDIVLELTALARSLLRSVA